LYSKVLQLRPLDHKTGPLLRLQYIWVCPKRGFKSRTSLYLFSLFEKVTEAFLLHKVHILSAREVILSTKKS